VTVLPGFDFDWSLATPADQVVRWTLELPRSFTVHWQSGAGGFVERSVSEEGLERWKVSCFAAEDLLPAAEFLKACLAPLAAAPLAVHPVYADRGLGLSVGWIFWHPKEAA